MANRGDIVIVVDLLDPQGRNPKDRACVLVSTPERIAAGGPYKMVAITTVLPNPLPFDHVPLPWYAQRHPRTGLNKRNAAVCSWRVEVEASRIDRTIGRIPDKHLYKIDAILLSLEKVEEA
jgi:mRNA-degrading endonuclease toxin of MazEF toxin-antitoxin module